ncbi:MAG: hypothetical protein Q9197_003313 [Variospora fuerteventurae]
MALLNQPLAPTLSQNDISFALVDTADFLIYDQERGPELLGSNPRRPGIRTLNPLTNKTTTILNNYFGYYLNNADDLSWFNKLTHTRPQLEPATYRFNSRTGAVNLVEDSTSAGISISNLIEGQRVSLWPDQAFEPNA